MAAPRIRIFSDLHFGDPRSTLTRLDALAPLLVEADEIVLNGDALDTIIPGHVPHLAAIRAFFAATARPVTWLSGNHDPDISDSAEHLFADQRVWVTHGDVLFDHVAPWSHHAAAFVRLFRDIPPEPGSPFTLTPLALRLRRHRRACVALLSAPDFTPHSPGRRVVHLFHTLFPPRRLLAILRAWRETPRLAAEFARRHHPRARVVVLGHTHYPGIWSPPSAPGLRVINTGAFARPFGGTFVELQGERIRVFRIVRRDAAFHPGPVLADFTLPPPLPPAPL